MTETTYTIQGLAAEAAEWFETAERVEGDESSRFIRTKDGAPEWVRDLVQAAHGDMFPDDYRYESIRDALLWIAEEDNDPEDAYEFAYSNVDVYSTNLTAWLGSHLSRIGYVDEATEELGDASGIIEQITRGQAVELAEVYGLVREALEGRL